MIRRFGDTPGFIVTAVLFSLVHLPARVLTQSENMFQLILSIVILLVGSVIFGYFAKKDKCIYGSALVHYVFNICQYVTSL